MEENNISKEETKEEVKQPSQNEEKERASTQNLVIEKATNDTSTDNLVESQK